MKFRNLFFIFMFIGGFIGFLDAYILYSKPPSKIPPKLIFPPQKEYQSNEFLKSYISSELNKSNKYKQRLENSEKNKNISEIKKQKWRKNILSDEKVKLYQEILEKLNSQKKEVKLIKLVKHDLNDDKYFSHTI